VEHYTLEEWVDFTRGVLPPEVRDAMQRHLNAPCRQCQDAVALWQIVLIRAPVEVGFLSAKEAVRQVKALFRLIRPSESRPGPLGPAERIFDSVLSPAPAGLRPASATGRWMVYRSGDCLVDLCLQAGSRGVSLVGQVLKASNPADKIL